MGRKKKQEEVLPPKVKERRIRKDVTPTKKKNETKQQSFYL